MSFSAALFLLPALSWASCVSFSSSTTGSALNNGVSLGFAATELHVAVAGFTLSPSGVSWATGQTADATVTVSAAFPLSSKPSASYNLNGTILNVGLTVSSTSSGAAPGWSALSAAVAVGAASFVATNDYPMAAAACGLLSTSILLSAQAACAPAVNVSIVLPAGLGLVSITAPTPSQLWYSIGPIPTSSPTVPTSMPTKIVPGVVYDGCFSLKNSMGFVGSYYVSSYNWQFNPDMTVEWCIGYAKNFGQSVIALSNQRITGEHSPTCIIGNDLQAVTSLAPSTQCNYTCPGDSTENCLPHCHPIAVLFAHAAYAAHDARPDNQVPVCIAYAANDAQPHDQEPVGFAHSDRVAHDGLAYRQPHDNVLRLQLGYLGDSMTGYEAQVIQNNFNHWWAVEETREKEAASAIAAFSQCPLCGPPPPLLTKPPTNSLAIIRPNQVQGATFVGCFQGRESGRRFNEPGGGYYAYNAYLSAGWVELLGPNTYMTLDICRDLASAAGYQYFVVRGGKPTSVTPTAVCGGTNDIGLLQTYRAPEAYPPYTNFGMWKACFSVPCPGNPAQTCGPQAILLRPPGSYNEYTGNVLVFKVNLATPATFAPTNAVVNTAYLGCFHDFDYYGRNASASLLRAIGFGHYKMNPNTASLQYCIADSPPGTIYFGLRSSTNSYGSKDPNDYECFFASNLTDAQLAYAMSYGKATSCTIPCPGNMQETCGGRWVFQLFAAVPTTSPTLYPSQAPTPPTYTLAPVSTSAAAYTYLGCFKPSMNLQNLLILSGSATGPVADCGGIGPGGSVHFECIKLASMSVEACAKQYPGATTFAMMYGSYCIPLSGFNPGVFAHGALSECNAPCSNGEACGGNVVPPGFPFPTPYLSVYALTTKSPTPAVG